MYRYHIANGNTISVIIVYKLPQNIKDKDSNGGRKVDKRKIVSYIKATAERDKSFNNLRLKPLRL
jgi:hypothetical protein